MRKRKNKGTCGHYEVPGVARIPWDERATKNKTRAILQQQAYDELEEFEANREFYEYGYDFDDSDDKAGLKMAYRSKSFDTEERRARRHNWWLNKRWNRRAGYDGSDPFPWSRNDAIQKQEAA